MSSSYSTFTLAPAASTPTSIPRQTTSDPSNTETRSQPSLPSIRELPAWNVPPSSLDPRLPPAPTLSVPGRAQPLQQFSPPKFSIRHIVNDAQEVAPTGATSSSLALPPSGDSRSAKNESKAAKSKRKNRKMSNSERGKLYRSRRKSYVQTLEQQVERLRDEVAGLQLQRTQSTSSQVPRDVDVFSSALAKTVHEYFKVFEHGVTVFRNNASIHHFDVVTSNRQASFLQTLVSPDLFHNSSIGIQNLLLQWERYCMFHRNLVYKMNNLRIIPGSPEPAVVARAGLMVEYTIDTIRNLFPHVMEDPELTQDLVGLQVEYEVDNWFFFGEDGRIVRFITDVGLSNGLVRALGSIQKALHVVDGAKYASDGTIQV